MRGVTWAVAGMLIISAVGCDGEGGGKPLEQGRAVPAGGTSSGDDETSKLLKGLDPEFPERIRTYRIGDKLVRLYLSNAGVEDISVLKGHPLKQLMLEHNDISDISALSGMPLERLYITGTKVNDLSPLEGMTLRELNAVDAPVSDVTPLAKVKLTGTLWLNNTRVKDISPLKDQKLISLDLEGTEVTDLTPLAKMESLERLSIVGTKVTDLSPLKGLKLKRLLITPEDIKTGWESIREMESLTGIGRSIREADSPGSAARFWALRDSEKPER